MKWLNDPKILKIALIAVAVLAVLFFVLWITGGSSNDGLEQLCSENAGNAASAFQAYADTGDLEDYREGLSRFRVFLEAWLALEGRSDAHQNGTDIYLSVLHDRSLLDAYLPDVVSVLENLSKDIQDADAHAELARLQIIFTS